MSRSITIEELNKRIDKAVCEYECAYERVKETEDQLEIAAKIVALQDLKIDLNDPEAVEDIAENVQQTLNVIEAKKITGNEL